MAEGKALRVVTAPSDINSRRETAVAQVEGLADRLRRGESVCALWVEANADGSLDYVFATDRLRSGLEVVGLAHYLGNAVLSGEWEG